MGRARISMGRARIEMGSARIAMGSARIAMATGMAAKPGVDACVRRGDAKVNSESCVKL